LNVGLACFSGNLIWPLLDFKRIGGFWNELHHGRCEDGELGLRAVAQGIPISYASLARGWHLDHPTDVAEKMRRNARDVPMLNERHPWVAGHDVFVVEEDGRLPPLDPRHGEGRVRRAGSGRRLARRGPQERHPHNGRAGRWRGRVQEGEHRLLAHRQRRPAARARGGT
jgi:hypothetical protein